MAKKIEIPKDNNIIKIPLEEAMPDNYLPYAVEVAKDRALPDVRDGLKPVHRRILYGAYMLRAFPDKPFFKSARIVGDILGKYHPHGDTSVYDAMVILAQDFTTRKPLIDGHGNWGSQDGDNAAAMRYTEARLTNLAMEMLRDIDKEVVDMVDNYSASEKEPKVLPSRYPNLLVNGAFGIAVGLATNIPPHNLNEVIDAALAYIDNNEITTTELMQYIKGPDLPTGGILIGKNALKSAYETGEGRVTLRAKTSIEKLESGRLGIVITEFPFRRNKARLLQIISEMTGDKKHSKVLEPIMDIRDESDRTGIRAVIELRKSVDNDGAEKVLKYLFKKTDLQCNISFNMVALADGKPETLGLKPIMMHYINHQKEIITRRTTRELQIAEKRFHIVEGFIKAIDIMDEIIATIRASKSKKDSEKNLCERFGFTEIQAEAIVELMLYKLTGLEIKTFEKEYKELEKEIKRLRKILDSEKELLRVIRVELSEIKDKYGDNRRTQIIEDDEEAKIDLDDLVVVEDIMVTLSNDGFIKRIPLKSYNRSNTNVEEIEYREGDFNKYLFQSNTKDTIMLFTEGGNMIQIKGVAVPEAKWKEKGERLDSILKGIDLSNDRITAVYSMSSTAEQKDFVFFTSKGNIKKTSIDKFNTSYTKIQALRLKENEKLIDVKLFNNDREEGYIRIKTEIGLIFSMEEPKIEAADRNIAGIQIFTLPATDEVKEVEYVEEMEFSNFWLNINSKGIIKALKTPPRENKRELNTATNSAEVILFFTNRGIVYSIPACMLENLSEDGVDISRLLEGMVQGKDKIIKILSVDNFDRDHSIFFFSKKGLVKKTILKEFEGSYYSTTAYKLKNEEDTLISIGYVSNAQATDIIIVTKRAMCIRFDSASVSSMGKIASGVTGISLKEDDEAIFAALVSNLETVSKNQVSSRDEVAISKAVYKEIVLTTSKKQKKNLMLRDVKIQNRAGRGSNIMLVVMDEFIAEVVLN